MKFKLIESNLSRIWQKKTKNRKQFAIIGSVDKDTGVDRYCELRSMVGDLSLKNRNQHIGWVNLKGTYTYENGITSEKMSLLIDNITKEQALYIAQKINQESIIYKDEKFFGFLDMDGNSIGQFSNDEKNMSFSSEHTKLFGSKLNSRHNKGQPFLFKMEKLSPKYAQSSVKNISGNPIIIEELFEINVNGTEQR